MFFPGESIGDLAINGTMNDIAMSGATSLFLGAGLITERMAKAAKIAEVSRHHPRHWRTASANLLI